MTKHGREPDEIVRNNAEKGAELMREFLVESTTQNPRRLLVITLAALFVLAALLLGTTKLTEGAAIIMLAFLGSESPSIRGLSSWLGPPFAYLVSTVVLNFIPSYLSLIETRWIISRIRPTTPLSHVAGFLARISNLIQTSRPSSGLERLY